MDLIAYLRRRLPFALATSALAISASSAALGQSVNMDADSPSWTEDRAGGAIFETIDIHNRSNVIWLGIRPPAATSSFNNWQGYQQRVDLPAGDTFLRGDIWIPDAWEEGTTTDYVRTGLWGAAMPEETVAGGSYVDAQATFPIISFTNVDGVGRLEVWRTTVSGGVSTGAWEVVEGTAGLLRYDSWNTFDLRMLPEQQRIEYLLNGEVFYVWENPVSEGSAPVAADQFWAIYLKARNNGVTSFDTYWSRLMAGIVAVEGVPITGSGGDLLLDGPSSEASVAGNANIAGSFSVVGGEGGKAVNFDGSANIEGSVYGTNTTFSFSSVPDTQTAIGGNLELEGTSSTTGGSPDNPVTVQGSVNVGQDGTFGGNFFVNGNVTNLGTTAPGNSIGLQVSSGLTWGPTSTYAVELDADGRADLVIVTGSAELDLAGMGSVVVSSLSSGAVALGHDYVIFAAQNIVNMFDPVVMTADLLYLTPTLHADASYDWNSFDLDWDNPAYDWPDGFDPSTLTAILLTLTADAAALETAAATPNQSAVAETLGAAAGGNAAAAAAFAQPDASSAQSALTQLSGAAHASVSSLLIEGTHLVDEAMNHRMQQAAGIVFAPSPLSGYAPFVAPTPTSDAFVIWGETIGAWGVARDPDNPGRREHETGGLLIGAESRLDSRSVFGVAGGYSTTSFTLADEGAQGNIENYQFGLYAATGASGFSVRGGAIYGHHGVALDRQITMAGFTDSLSSRYDADVLRGFAELAYEVDLGGVVLEPFAGVAGTYASGYDYEETGGDAALSGSVAAQAVGWTTVGARLAADLTVGDGRLLQVTGAAGWRHALGELTPVATHALAGAADFAAAGIPIAWDVLVTEVGASLALTDQANLSLGYAGQFADGHQTHAVQAGLAMQF